MKRIGQWLKKEPMLTVSVAAALLSLFLTPPSAALVKEIDWRTLGTLFMMLTVLEGFKQENIFAPVLRLAGKLGTLTGLGLFLVFAVFFSSMFVTNDVSLIIFVPLTILLFRAAGRESFILPLLAMENIAAVRGSLLTPFGSPQNLFIFGRSGVSPWRFMAYMFPLWILSGALLAGFVLFLFRKNLREKAALGPETFAEGSGGGKGKKAVLLCLFALVIATIVSRTPWWYVAVGIVLLAVLIADRRLLLKTDYPSWLYAVTMGATTVWERWNGMYPDGTFADKGMNSFNHYAYGSVFSWMFRRLAGIAPVESAPGYAAVRFAPAPDERIPWVKASLETDRGTVASSYQKTETGWRFRFTVPAGSVATAELFGRTYPLHTGDNVIEAAP